jgi:hypothetical protein
MIDSLITLYIKLKTYKIIAYAKKNSLIKSVKPWIFEMINCNMEKELHIDSMNLKTKMITFAHIVMLWQFFFIFGLLAIIGVLD